MLEFWKNPEFVRYRRSELRPGRAASAAGITALLCYLLGLTLSADHSPKKEYDQTFYMVLMGVQGVLVMLWCFGACLQAISSERDKKTWEFQRTTRLTAAELMVGKLTGAPVMGYFIFLVILPVLLVLGLLAVFNPLATLASEVLILFAALLLGLFGLVASMKMEKSAGGVAVFALLFLWWMGAMAAAFSEGDHTLFPGANALSPVPAILLFHGPQIINPPHFAKPLLFGQPIPYMAMTLLLYGCIAAWLVTMLRRGMKKDFPEIRLLSRWQALGFMLFVNGMFFALLNPKASLGYGTVQHYGEDFGVMAVVLNLMTCGFLGLITITPPIYFKAWYRRWQSGEESYFSENGPPWPWLLLSSALGAGMMAVYALGLNPSIPIANWHFGRLATYLALWMAYLLRDFLFLQGMAITRISRAMLAGLGLLSLYYVTVFIIAIAAENSAGGNASRTVFTLFSPFVDLDNMTDNLRILLAVGIGIQLLISVLLITLTNKRLAEKAVYPLKKAA